MLFKKNHPSVWQEVRVSSDVRFYSILMPTHMRSYLNKYGNFVVDFKYPKITGISDSSSFNTGEPTKCRFFSGNKVRYGQYTDRIFHLEIVNGDTLKSINEILTGLKITRKQTKSYFSSLYDIILDNANIISGEKQVQNTK